MGAQCEEVDFSCPRGYTEVVTNEDGNLDRAATLLAKVFERVRRQAGRPAFAWPRRQRTPPQPAWRPAWWPAQTAHGEMHMR